MFVELFAPSVGGQELFFEGLARQLVRKGHSVDVHCIGHEAGLAAVEDLDGIAIYRCPTDKSYKAPRFRAMKRAWPTIFKYALQVRRIASAANYDVVFLNQWPLLHAVALTKSQRDKAVIHWCEIRNGLLFRTIQAFLPRLVARNVAVSDAVGRVIQRHSNGPVQTLPSGIEVERYRSLQRSERSGICYLGRIATHKNISLLIDTFELVKDQGYNGQLTLAGEGPALDDVRERARRSKYAADIVLPGLILDNEKIELLSRSDVLVISSVREGFPRVVAEAMASGLPVVTCDYETNGTKDVVGSYDNGVVTRPTAPHLADGIRDVFARWDYFSEKGRAAAMTLSWALIADDFERLVVAHLGLDSAAVQSRLNEASVA